MIDATPIKTRQAGDGVEVAFDFAFSVASASEVKAGKILNSTDVLTLGVLGVDYTVTLNTTTPGGTVTYTVAPTALQDAFIYREVAIDQQADIPTNGLFREQQIEEGLDHLARVDQQLAEQLDRAVKLPITSTVTEVVLPEPEDGKILTWSGTSGLLENTDLLPGPTGPTGPAGANGADGEDGVFSEIASQAEAEAGAENTKGMTALRTSQAIAALQRGLASQAEAEAGTDNTKDMTPLRVAQAIAALGGGGSALGTWTTKSDNTVYQAATDLFVVSYLTVGGAAAEWSVYTDSSNPPTTKRATGKCASSGELVYVGCPVKKNDYYKVVNTAGTPGTTYVIPMGS